MSSTTKINPINFAILVVLTSISFSPILFNSFINFDDPLYVTKNPFILSGLTFENIKWALTAQYNANWHPLTWISHMLDVSLFGADAPGLHHFVSLILHLLGGVFLYKWLLLLKDKFNLHPIHCLLLTTLFLIHPLRVESVAWASERKDVLCFLFWIMTCYYYACYQQQQKKKYFFLYHLSFILGLLSKPMIVTLPLILVIYNWIDREGRTLIQDTLLSVRRSILLWIVTAISIYLTLSAQKAGGAVRTIQDFTLWQRLTNAIHSYYIYIKQLFIPYPLLPFYPHPQDTLSPLMVSVCAAIIIALSIYFFKNRCRKPLSILGWLWYLVSLLPVIGIIQVGLQAHADRYTYIPHIGLLLIFLEYSGSIKSTKTKINQTLFILLIPVFGVLTFFQCKNWKNDFALFHWTQRHSPKNDLAFNNLGVAYLDINKPEKAIEYFEKSLNIAPGKTKTLNNLGQAHLLLRKPSEAAIYFQKSLKLNPDYILANTGLGKAYLLLNQNQKALEHLKRAKKLSPFPDKGNLYHLGVAHQRLGQFKEAATEMLSAVKLDPKNAKAFNELGGIQFLLKNHDKAIQYIQKALEFDPKNKEYRWNLSHVFFNLGKFDEAMEELHILSIDHPKYLRVWLRLGNVYLQDKKLNKAKEALQKAYEIAPNQVSTNFQLGVCNFYLKDFDSSKKFFNETLRLNPDYHLSVLYLALMEPGITKAYKEYSSYLKSKAPKLYQQLQKQIQQTNQ